VGRTEHRRVRLLNRTTRSVALTEAGARLAERLGPALGEVEATLDMVNRFRDRPAGTLRLNVPVSAAIVPPSSRPIPTSSSMSSLRTASSMSLRRAVMRASATTSDWNRT
jgi:DNA-binding transcriptional LysR family regulator